MKAVLIVEGLNDADQIHKAIKDSENVVTLVTEGTKFNNRIKAELENYMRNGYDAYILSDPDLGGDSLASMVNLCYPQIPRIEVDTKHCGYFTGKRMKAGIEYASYDYLKKIIYPLIGLEYKEKVSIINWD